MCHYNSDYSSTDLFTSDLTLSIFGNCLIMLFFVAPSDIHDYLMTSGLYS